MLVQVQQYHIDNGRQGDAKKCPIALAILDMGYQHVLVGCSCGTQILVSKSITSKTTVYRAPDDVVLFIARFDKWGKGSAVPFTFVLDEEVPDEELMSVV